MSYYSTSNQQGTQRIRMFLYCYVMLPYVCNITTKPILKFLSDKLTLIRNKNCFIIAIFIENNENYYFHLKPDVTAALFFLLNFALI